MRFISRLLHAISHRFCLRHLDETSWNGCELRCPVCNHLIAYVFPLHGEYQLYVCHPFQDKRSAIESILPQKFQSPVEKETVTIDWELLRPPIEPLLSDTWDSDEAYENCIQSYIQEKRKEEIDLQKEVDLNGSTEQYYNS